MMIESKEDEMNGDTTTTTTKSDKKYNFGPRTNKDSRSFRPSSIDEVNNMNDYKPLTFFKYTKKDGTVHHIGCNNSLEDIIIIITLYITFYSFCIGFFVLALKGAVDTEDTSTLLWSYLYMLIIMIVLVLGATYFNRKDINEKKRLKKENEIRLSLKKPQKQQEV